MDRTFALPTAYGAKVDRARRIITGLSAVTAGPVAALGVWLDSEFLDQVARAGSAGDGSKCHFSHSSLFRDGLGYLLGRMKDFRRAGPVVRCDLHFADVASSAPAGDLAGYVMDLAEDDAAAFGASLAFDRDGSAEKAFALKHGGRVLTDQYGFELIADFKSPDPANTQNLLHARLSRLRAVDLVDEPAANSGGLFSESEEQMATMTVAAAQADRVVKARELAKARGWTLAKALSHISGESRTPREQIARELAKPFADRAAKARKLAAEKKIPLSKALSLLSDQERAAGK